MIFHQVDTTLNNSSEMYFQHGQEEDGKTVVKELIDSEGTMAFEDIVESKENSCIASYDFASQFFDWGF